MSANWYTLMYNISQEIQLDNTHIFTSKIYIHRLTKCTCNKHCTYIMSDFFHNAIFFFQTEAYMPLINQIRRAYTPYKYAPNEIRNSMFRPLMKKTDAKISLSVIKKYILSPLLLCRRLITPSQATNHSRPQRNRKRSKKAKNRYWEGDSCNATCVTKMRGSTHHT